jgi:hypothetical protein
MESLEHEGPAAVSPFSLLHGLFQKRHLRVGASRGPSRCAAGAGRPHSLLHRLIRELLAQSGKLSLLRQADRRRDAIGDHRGCQGEGEEIPRVARLRPPDHQGDGNEGKLDRHRRREEHPPEERQDGDAQAAGEDACDGVPGATRRIIGGQQEDRREEK